MATTSPDAPEPLIFSKFTGLRNTVTLERLTPQELATAKNVDLDDAGQLHRRRGYIRRLSGNCHSLFEAADGTVYVVRDGALCILNPNFTVTALSRKTIADRLCYAQVGDVVYFSSQSANGKIIDGAVTKWGALDGNGKWLSPVLHPTPTLAAIKGKLLGNPPMASYMTYWNGRIYMADGRQVWATELYAYDFVDRTRNFWTFEADVTMLGAVMDGVYVGTEDGLWFVSGPTFDKMKRQRVMDSPVIAGSMVDIPAELANPKQVGENADTQLKVSISFLSENGFCVASDGGEAYNLTEDKFVFPGSRSVAAMFRRQDGMNQYVAVADSGGTPTSNARIGDYVDAELIRATDMRVKSAYDLVTVGDQVEATIIGV